MAGEVLAYEPAAALVIVPTAAADWLVIAPTALTIIAGAALLMIRHRTRIQAGVAIGALAILVLINWGLLVRVLNDGPQVMTMGRWLPPFGITFAADALGATFAFTGAVVALLAAIYSVQDISTSGRRYGFYPFLLLMMAGVEGAFLTGDVFNLYVWFEVFLVSSFGLIVLGSEHRQLDGALKYAVLNLVATTLFLIGTAFLYGLFGTLNMADIARKASALRETAPLMTLATLYLLAFGMKAAAFPVNFWLPASYHTPRIVVGALFAGLLTKVGIYALLRTEVMLFPVERAVLSPLIGWVAIGTMIFGALGALAQTDIRRILGFVVISGIGIMLAGLAIGTPAAVAGAIVYAVHSMLVMTALYLTAGLIYDRSGSYSLHSVQGLYRAAPMLAAMFLLLMLAAAGLPPGSGLWPKIMLVREALGGGRSLLAAAILFSGLLVTIALGRVFTLAFWRDGTLENVPDIQGAGRHGGGIAPVAILTGLSVLIGLWPEPLIAVANRAAASLADPAAYIEAVFPVVETGTVRP